MDERTGMVVKWQSLEYKGCVVNAATPNFMHHVFNFIFTSSGLSMTHAGSGLC